MIVGGNHNASACVAKGSNQSINNNTKTAITFDSTASDLILIDTNGFYNPANTDRLTIPAGMNGVYLITACIKYKLNGTNTRWAYIDWFTSTGAAASLRGLYIKRAIAGNHTHVSCHLGPITMRDNEYVVLSAFQLSGASLDVMGDEDRSTFLSLIRLSS